MRVQKNRFALIYFGKIQFLPPCIWNLPFMSYRLSTGWFCFSIRFNCFPYMYSVETRIARGREGMEQNNFKENKRFSCCRRQCLHPLYPPLANTANIVTSFPLSWSFFSLCGRPQVEAFLHLLVKDRGTAKGGSITPAKKRYLMKYSYLMVCSFSGSS